jgi:hypothetical protein
MNKDYSLKEQGLENVLENASNCWPRNYSISNQGGAVDMHYLSHIRGTGFGTMELLDPDGNGPKTEQNRNL